MRVTDSEQFSMATYQMQTQSQRLFQLRQEAASGKKNLQASDDPTAYSRALFLQSAKSGSAAFEDAANRAQQRLQGYDQTLSSINDIVQQARTIALQGASDSTDQTALSSLSKTVDDLLERTLVLANDQQDGRYIFAGTRSDAPPFVAARSGEKIATVTFAGNDRSQDVALDDGGSVRSTVSATQAFGSPPDGPNGVLGTLISLRDALKSNDRKTAGLIGDRLQVQSETLVSARADVGTRQQHLDALSRFRQATVQQIDLQLSAVQDADLPATITALTQQELAFQGALQVAARLQRNTLFELLK